MFRKLREYHAKKMAQYREDAYQELEPWKKRVMQIHEQADFLFYYDEMEFTKEIGSCRLRGEIVKGLLEIGAPLLLLDGQGNILGRALLGSEVEEKEETRKGFRRKRNDFQIKIITIYRKNAENMQEEEWLYLINKMESALSLVINGA